MLLRIATAAVLIPIVLTLVWYGPPALLAAIAAIVAIMALFEFFAIGDKIGLRAFKKWTYFGAALIFFKSGKTETPVSQLNSSALSFVRSGSHVNKPRSV